MSIADKIRQLETKMDRFASGMNMLFAMVEDIHRQVVPKKEEVREGDGESNPEGENRDNQAQGERQ